MDAKPLGVHSGQFAGDLGHPRKFSKPILTMAAWHTAMSRKRRERAVGGHCRVAGWTVSQRKASRPRDPGTGWCDVVALSANKIDHQGLEGRLARPKKDGGRLTHDGSNSCVAPGMGGVITWKQVPEGEAESIGVSVMAGG